MGLLDPDSPQGIDEKYRRELAPAQLIGDRGFGFLTPQPIHYNTISSYLRNKDLSHVLRDLIFKSSLPLPAVEKVFAMDSTTFKHSRALALSMRARRGGTAK
jgi:hypothetical protein